MCTGSVTSDERVVNCQEQRFQYAAEDRKRMVAHAGQHRAENRDLDDEADINEANSLARPSPTWPT